MSNGNNAAFPLNWGSMEFSTGLTKREFFAAFALTGLCATQGLQKGFLTDSELGNQALRAADALLAEIEEHPIRNDTEDDADPKDKIGPGIEFAQGHDTQSHDDRAQVGESYVGTIIRLTLFGAFVEILPGIVGWLSISEVASHEVIDIHDELNTGQKITVKCLRIDSQGNIGLSRKILLE